MHYLWFIFIIISIIFAVVGCKRTPSENTPPKHDEGIKNQLGVDNVSLKPKFSRASLKKRLQQLAQSEAPTKLAIGAMCYKVAGPPQRAEYVCPECSERTLYSLKTGGQHDWAVIRTIQQEIQGCRRMILHIKGLSVEIDESQFCKKCNPNVTDPRLVLLVYYTREKIHRFPGITEDDLKLIKEFLAGEDKHVLSNDRERPLKNYIPQIERILGLNKD